MKKLLFSLACLFALLAGATNSFAAVIWTAPSTSSIYGGLSNQWTASTGDISAVQGPSSVLTLTLQLNATGLAGATRAVDYLKGSGFAATPTAYVLQPLTLPGTSSASWTVSYDVLYNAAGIYNFSSYLKTPGASSSWTLTSATLSNPAKTPIPAAGLLLGSGVLGLFGLGKARRKRG